MPRTVRNFGRNIEFTPVARYTPASEDEVLDILDRHSSEHVRAIGALHSWSGAPATDGAVLDMRRFRRVHIQRRPDGTARVTVGAGCRMKRLVRLLDRAGLALPTIGAVLSQAIAGAVATGTHGSGPSSLSHYVEAVRFAAYDEAGQPRIYEWSSGDELRAARCSLGRLGVMLSVTLSCVPTYWAEEKLERAAGIDNVLDGEEAYPLQQAILLPYSWAWHVYRRRAVDKPGLARRLAALLRRPVLFLGRDLLLHGIIRVLAYPRARTRPMRFIFSRPIGWVLREPGRIDASTQVLTLRHELFRHVEMEVLVPRARLAEAVRLVRALTAAAADDRFTTDDEFAAVLDRSGTRSSMAKARGSYTQHYPIVIRRVLPDDTLISMSADDQAPRYALSFFTYERDRTGFALYARLIAEILARECDARIHWGKYFPLTNNDVRDRYPRLDEFAAICRRVDPNGVFGSEYTRRVLGF